MEVELRMICDGMEVGGGYMMGWRMEVRRICEIMEGDEGVDGSV